MIFKYDELKECVTEDFQRFYEMGFSEKQIFPAIMNEYEHGEDFCELENVYIHIFVALNYVQKEMRYDEIVREMEILIDKKMKEEIKENLGDEYNKFIIDITKITNWENI